jgi:3-oxoacyl-(acyl-carrier-protein) synthase
MPHVLLLLLLLLQSLDTEGYIAKKMERRLDKAIKFVLVSGKKALADAGLDWQGQDIKVCVLIVCTCPVMPVCLKQLLL